MHLMSDGALNIFKRRIPMKSMKKILIVAAIALIAIVCASSAVSAGWLDFLGGSGNSTDTSLDGKEVNLAAAASLKNVFDDKLIPMFQEKYQGAKVTPTYASSGDLQTQIENGLETDVFMSASNKQMNALVNESLIDNNTNLQFLENKVVLIVPANSSSNISSFDDLANASGVIAIGDPESVPAGQYAKEALTNLGIWDSVESKLSLGTDVTKSMPDDVKVVCEAPEGSLNTSVIYPVAMIKDAKDADAAQAFLDFLQTKEAKDVFVEYGFTIHE